MLISRQNSLCWGLKFSSEPKLLPGRRPFAASHNFCHPAYPDVRFALNRLLLFKHQNEKKSCEVPHVCIILVSFDLTHHSFRITLCLALNKSYMFFIHDKNFFLPSTVPTISGFPRLHLKARPTGFFVLL